MGYKYQFITLAGIHSMWFNMFDLAHAYAQGEGMKHYVEKVQQRGLNPAAAAIPSPRTSRKWEPAILTG
ncbi:Isocitrate lyase [Serratia rubidaea]|uniref:Isocitrate lyase n=1 Tax=Serratia rubidaea TaxID=61652 RepID=A0A3S4I024_SERRU|nr:Isocitrate lyase [Serratia rubidaea]